MSQMQRSFFGVVLIFFCFRLGDKGCEKTLNFDAEGPKVRRERVFEMGSCFGGPGADALAINVGEGGRSFVDTTGVVGALDKGDGDERKIELSISSRLRGEKDALRLRDVVATAGTLALATCDDGVVTLLSFDLSGFLSGDEVLPLSGEERCFPVAL